MPLRRRESGMENLPTVVGALLLLGVAAYLFGPSAMAMIQGPPEIDVQAQVGDKEYERIGEMVQDGELRLVDVRTPAEYQQNGVAGAVNIPLHELSQRVDELGDREETLLLYCRSGNRSGQARRFLEGEGFEQVVDLRTVNGAQRAMQQPCGGEAVDDADQQRMC